MSNTFPLAGGSSLAPALSLTGTPPDAVAGKGYFFRPQPVGGAPGRTLTFALTAGTLPDGFTFSTHTGTIRGSATAAGTTSGLTISVTDGFSIATLGPLSIIVAAGAGGGGVGNVMRAMGQNTYTTIAGFGIGAGNIAQALRTLHRAQYRTDAMSVTYAVFYNSSADNPILDTKYTTPITFGAKYELNPVQGFTGIDPGVPFLWEGSKVKRFDPSGWDPNVWIIESDVMELGRYIEANELFGCQSAQVLDTGVSGNLMPYQRPLTNYLQRYTGRVNAAGDILVGGTGSFFTRTTYTDVGTSRIGSAGGLGPVRFKFRVPKTVVSMFGVGDSITQDQKVGYGTNPVLFDVQGDAKGNRSFFGMAADRLGVMAMDTGRGSHGDKYLRTQANWPGLLQILVTSGATCIDELMGANDFTSSFNPSTRAASTVTSKFTVRRNGSGVYIATSADGATTGAGAGPVGTVVGATETDGTVTWAYLGPYDGTGVADQAYPVFGWKCEALAIIKAAFIAAGKPVPTLRVMTPLPKAGATTDNLSTPENQTVSANNPNRARLFDLYNNMALRSILGCDVVFSISTGIETAQNSGIIQTNGATGYVLDVDKVHPLDQGHVNLAALYPAPPAVTPAQSA